MAVLQRAINATRRLDKLIQDVLAFSRISRIEPKLETVNIDRLLRGIMSERPELQPPCADITVTGELIPMLGDEASLTQCLNNLLGNSVKFVARLSDEPRSPAFHLMVNMAGGTDGGPVTLTPNQTIKKSIRLVLNQQFKNQMNYIDP